MDDHDFNALQLALRCAQPEHQLSTEAQQAILVRDHQPLKAPVEDQLQEFLQAFLAVVHPAAEVADNPSTPSFRGAVGFQSRLLAVEISFLVVAGHSGIADGQRFLRRSRSRRSRSASTEEIGYGVVPGTALCLPSRQQFTVMLPTSVVVPA